MNSVLLPIFIPLVFALLTGVLKKDNRIALFGFALHFLASTYLLWECSLGAIEVVSVGNWLPPYGIMLLADLFSTLFLFAISLVFLAVSFYTLKENHHTPLLFILLSGISLCLLTADFFNLFVAFEVMLCASCALVALELPSKKLGWAFSYLLINLIATLGFLCAAGMIYGLTGHLNMAALAQVLEDPEGNSLVLGWAYLLLGVFGVKAAVFPVYFWLPKTYSYLPSSMAALFAGSLTKVGIYVLIRLFVTVLPATLNSIYDVILILSAFTMLAGVLGAIASSTIREILSYHIVSQIGYMLLGLSLYTPLAVAAALLFIVHNIWVKVSLFLIGGVAEKTCATDHLKKMGNLSLYLPWLTTLFLVQAFSLVGFPPLSGFWGKYLLIFESLKLEHYLIAGVMLLTSWLTLFSMLKIWIGAFWKESKHSDEYLFLQAKEKYSSIALLVFASLVLGFGIEPIYQKVTLASEQIFQKEAYMEAIFSTAGKGIG